MSGAIPPLPNTPPWRGAQLKHRDNLPLPYLLPMKHFPVMYQTTLRYIDVVTSNNFYT
jgi:hypothetical protein